MTEKKQPKPAPAKPVSPANQQKGTKASVAAPSKPVTTPLKAETSAKVAPVPAPPAGAYPHRPRGPDKQPRAARGAPLAAAAPPAPAAPPVAMAPATPPPAPVPAGPPPLTPERRAELAAESIAAAFDTLTGLFPPEFTSAERKAVADVWRPLCLAYGDKWFAHPATPALLVTMGVFSWRVKNRIKAARAQPAHR